MMGLTSEQYDQEPMDELFTNIYIHAQIEKKQEAERKWLTQ